MGEGEEAHHGKPRQRERRTIFIVTRVGLALLLTWTLAPIVWILLTALKTPKEIYAYPPTFFPETPTLDNFNKSLFASPFPGYVLNSIIVAVSVTALSIVIGALAAYAIGRMHFPGRPAAARALVMSYLMPPALLFIPLFLVLQSVGLIDTRTGLVVAYLTFTVPFCTWMLIGYFRTIPREIDEAARMDGASATRTLSEIVLPLALPGLAVAA
ncbi:MAG: carbohydrate ABC transporter permease, partial [Pseudomonadota bacterium]